MYWILTAYLALGARLGWVYLRLMLPLRLDHRISHFRWVRHPFLGALVSMFAFPVLGSPLLMLTAAVVGPRPDIREDIRRDLYKRAASAMKVHP